MDFDKFGHCILCSKCLLIEQVIGGRVERRFTAEHDEVEVLLDDGSRMRICTCRKCKKEMGKKDYNKIMEKVRNGWHREIDDLRWDAEKKKKYFDRYGSLQIVTKSDSKPDDILDRALVAHKKANGGGKWE
jgi:predicted molibdopterin-dependent oxidoreductase YjgC